MRACLSVGPWCAHPYTEAMKSAVLGNVEYEPASLRDAIAVDDVVAASTRIGVEAQSYLSPGTDNAVVSPVSLVMAFGMLAEGANAAAEELDAWLGARGEDRSRVLSALRVSVREFDGDPSTVQDDELPEVPLLHLANQVTVREGGGAPSTRTLRDPRISSASTGAPLK